MVVRYEQRASHDKERERKRTDMELNFDGRRVAVDYTVPNTLTVKQRTAGIKYDPYEVRNAAQILNVDNPSTYPASPRPPGLPRLPRLYIGAIPGNGRL